MIATPVVRRPVLLNQWSCSQNAGRLRVWTQVEARCFDLSRPALKPIHLPVQWVTCPLPGVKRRGRGADQPPLPSAEVENGAELHLCLLSVPTWYATGRDTLPFNPGCVEVKQMVKNLIINTTEGYSLSNSYDKDALNIFTILHSSKPPVLHLSFLKIHYSVCIYHNFLNRHSIDQFSFT